jgi:hypothetical protein
MLQSLHIAKFMPQNTERKRVPTSISAALAGASRSDFVHSVAGDGFPPSVLGTWHDPLAQRRKLLAQAAANP